MNLPVNAKNVVRFNQAEVDPELQINDLIDSFVITSSMLENPIFIEKKKWNAESKFDDFFTQLKEFNHAKTIFNMKKLVVRRRTSNMISKAAARFAWNGVISRIEHMSFSSANDFLINGWGSIESIVDGYSATINASTRRAVIEMFSRSCSGFLYPDKIAQFKTLHWDVIKSQIDASLS